MKILIACEYSGTVRDSFKALGHEAMSCDLLPTERPGSHYQGDIRDVLTAHWDLMIAHPPCTRLTNAGVRWLHKPPRGKTVAEMWDDLDSAVKFYLMLRDAPIEKKVLENPVMHIHARERLGFPARSIVQPWWFGEPAFKATGFELIGLPELVATNKLTPPKQGTQEHKEWSRIHRMPPGPDRWKERSRTYQGIADAMAMQWGGRINSGEQT